MKNTLQIRLVSMLLAVALICGLLPVAVFAQTPEVETAAAQAVNGSTEPVASPEEPDGAEPEEPQEEEAPAAEPVTVEHALPATMEVGQRVEDALDCNIFFRGLTPGEKVWLSLGDGWEDGLFSLTCGDQARVFEVDDEGTAINDQLAALGTALAPGQALLQPQYCRYEEGVVPTDEDFIPVGEPIFLTIEQSGEEEALPPEEPQGGEPAALPGSQPDEGLVNAAAEDTVATPAEDPAEIPVLPAALTLRLGAPPSTWRLEGAGQGETVSWTSSNTAVVSVVDGQLTACAAGTATITAQGSSATVYCAVTVKPAANKVVVDQTKVVLKVGKSTTLTATVSPANAFSKAVSWKSSNTAIATISAAGKLTAKAAGTVIITCNSTDTPAKQSIRTVVVKPPASKVVVDQTKVVLKVGKATTLTATVSPTNAYSKAVSWKSDNTAIATISAAGKLTAKAVGSVKITCTSKDTPQKYSVRTIIVRPPASKVVVDQTGVVVKKGKSVTLTATVSPKNAYSKAVSWKSSNKAIATISAAGKLTAKAVGSVKITCTSKDTPTKKSIRTIVVKPGASKVSLNKKTANVKVGRTTKLTATVAPSNAYNKKITWTSSNTKVATVTSGGTVKAKKTGTVTITAKNADSGKLATCKVVVTKRNVQAEINKILAKYPNGTYFTKDGGLPREYGGTSELLGKCGAFVSYVESELFSTYEGFMPSEWWWYEGYVPTKQVGSAARGKAQIIALLNQAKPGDYIYANPLSPDKIEHYAIYLGHDANYMYLYECNWDNKSGIRYNAPQTYDWYTDNREVYLYRATNYEKLYA